MNRPDNIKLIIAFTLSFCCTIATHANALTTDDMSGYMLANINNQQTMLPMLNTDIDADIAGDIVAVRITQQFVNPTSTAINAEYLFPLNDLAAIYDMEMRIGNKLIKAKAQEKQQAKQTYNKAQAEGKNAALLVQHRPNMFTQHVANIMPQQKITITISYTHVIPKIDSHYELVIPTVVGPRFNPQTDNYTNEDIQEPKSGQWHFSSPQHPPVKGLDIPKTVEDDRLQISVNLNAGIPIFSANSSTHQISTSAQTESNWSISLANGSTIDNRDFVLKYQLADQDISAGLLSYAEHDTGYFSLLIEPPLQPADEQITPREMVFLLDCSGSMSGQPMQASKAFMRAALMELRPTDTFRIIRFSDSATEFSRVPLQATQANIQKGINYTNSLYGSGGTMMTSGLYQAFNAPIEANKLRIVTFLTDGYIGNEQEILKITHQHLNDARIYALGVGTSVNRFLLNELANVGRGTVRYIDPTKPGLDEAVQLAKRLNAPVLTNITIDWTQSDAVEIQPNHINDLFAGDSIRISGKYTTPGTHTIYINGEINGQSARLPLDVTFAPHSATNIEGEALKLIWARNKIKHLMNESIKPNFARQNNASLDEIREQVTSLGIYYNLMTQWTSFVAVSETIVNFDPASTNTLDVPLPMVDGTNANAYPKKANQFSGHATPEPSTWIGLIFGFIMLGGFKFLSRRR